MPGHGYQKGGTSYKMWSSLNYLDFLEGLRNDIKIARKKYEKVFLFGQSMGGALALILAGEGLVDAVATTAPGIMKIPKIVLPLIKGIVFLFGRKQIKVVQKETFIILAMNMFLYVQLMQLLGWSLMHKKWLRVLIVRFC